MWILKNWLKICCASYARFVAPRYVQLHRVYVNRSRTYAYHYAPTKKECKTMHIAHLSPCIKKNNSIRHIFSDAVLASIFSVAHSY